MHELTEAQVRAAWIRHQGLARPAGTDPAAVVAATGWIRTLGGVDGYLSLAARLPGLTAEAVHAAVTARELQVLPAARGCIYLVPRSQAPLALALARDLTEKRAAREAEKAGVAPGELDGVAAAVEAALAGGPATTAELRRDLPEGTVRSLGEAGKKLGLTSTLPPALRVLEFAGRIVRQPVEGRLDTERYAWALAPEAAGPDPRPAAARATDLARLFLRWFGPTTPEHLADFSGLSKTAARRAVAACDPVAVPTPAGEAFVLPDQQAALGDPAAVVPRLLPGMDNLLVWHGGPPPFVHPDDRDVPVAPWGSRQPTTWGEVRHVLSRPVLAGGRLAGLWDYDPDQQVAIAGPLSPGLPEGVAEALDGVTALLRDGIGHGRAFSLERDDHLRARCKRVRER